MCILTKDLEEYKFTMNPEEALESEFHFFFFNTEPLSFFFLSIKIVLFYFIFQLDNIVLVLPYIKMKPPQVYMCNPS